MVKNFVILNIGNKVAGVSKATGLSYEIVNITLAFTDGSGTVFTSAPSRSLEGLSVGDEVTADVHFQVRMSASGNTYNAVSVYNLSNLSKVQQYEN